MSTAAAIILKRFFFLILGVIVTSSCTAAFECLHLDDDDRIQESLISPKNYYNISRSIYPSIDVPSLYVKITVRFNSSTTNGSFTMLYTWSKSCLYVATQFVSLSAMNVYSLGTIWPNRRETELFITLPAFCNSTAEDDINKKMIYFLSTLEDIAIIPTAQDPRLNTVECVVEGHDNFNVKIFSGSRKLLMCVCWCILIFSAVLGSFVSSYVVRWLPEDNSEEQNTSLKYNIKSLNFLVWMVSFFEEALIISAVVLAVGCGRGGMWYPVTYFIAVRLFSCLLYYFLFEKGRKCIPFFFLLVSPCLSIVVYLKRSAQNSEKVRNTMIYFTFLTAFHHLSWIMQGVMTEPLWAVPFLAVICCVWVGVYLLVYFYHDSKLTEWRPKLTAVTISLALVVSVVLQLLALVVVAQSFLSTDPVTGFASSVLTVVGTWWLQRVVMKPKTEQSQGVATEVVQPQTGATRAADADGNRTADNMELLSRS